MWEKVGVPTVRTIDSARAASAARSDRSRETRASSSSAPGWMQDRGLEWTYRIAQEPRRLLPRYLYYNPRFLLAFARQLRRERRR